MQRRVGIREDEQLCISRVGTHGAVKSMDLSGPAFRTTIDLMQSESGISCDSFRCEFLSRVPTAVQGQHEPAVRVVLRSERIHEGCNDGLLVMRRDKNCNPARRWPERETVIAHAEDAACL